MSSIYDWSLTAADNQNSDQNINWMEGQPPSSVNDSARFMMQRVREFITDTSGIKTSTGAENSYQIQAASTITKYPDGFRLTFRAHQTCTGAATLSVNNIGAKSVYIIGPAGAVQNVAGALVQDGIYELFYNAALSNKQGGFLLINPSAVSAPVVIPVGSVFAFAMKIVPSGFLYCNGQIVRKNAYPALLAAIGTIWNQDNKVPVDSFQLPDYRGQFIRGWSDGMDSDPNRVFAQWQDSANKVHNHVGSTTVSSGSHSHTFTGGNRGTADGTADISLLTPYGQTTTSSAGDHTHNLLIVSDGEKEARPVNKTAVYGIKY